ncbi:4Fe-4S binding protein [bacterium]|nr:4Fe-4S binding protein [candidate division CSSED10-310 bacterium]
MALVNRTARIRNGEDIDEIRNSLYELRITLKSLRAEWNFKLAKIQVNLLKYQEKIPRDRIPYFITGECIACGSCLPECPTNAITENLLFEIDPALCIACRKCAEICPVGACRPLEEPAGAFSA